MCLSVRLFVPSRCSTKTAIRRITQTTPRHSLRTLLFCCRKPHQNSNRITPTEAPNAGGYRVNAGAVAENWRLFTRSVVNLARSQVYHTERPWVTCLPRVRRDAAHRAGLSATADRSLCVRDRIGLHYSTHVRSVHDSRCRNIATLLTMLRELSVTYYLLLSQHRQRSTKEAESCTV